MYFNTGNHCALNIKVPPGKMVEVEFTFSTGVTDRCVSTTSGPNSLGRACCGQQSRLEIEAMSDIYVITDIPLGETWTAKVKFDTPALPSTTNWTPPSFVTPSFPFFQVPSFPTLPYPSQPLPNYTLPPNFSQMFPTLPTFPYPSQPLPNFTLPPNFFNSFNIPRSFRALIGVSLKCISS
ncbi:hypothetical protein Pmani_014897 [Petrolisthes manimaculis]|uniref:CUB domain-containing protein n=1 Tax=Petrolisthes manimaculis TaxID=1843537 RepID=A0AAE1UCK8_9EUCA|nr:hypothetical protein Pmani_014897 [Petrolisthes manimaculis]